MCPGYGIRMGESDYNHAGRVCRVVDCWELGHSVEVLDILETVLVESVVTIMSVFGTAHYKRNFTSFILL